jgi:5'-nucleotidase
VRVLVTNDDGIEAPGLPPLARAMVELGHDVIAVAPMEDRSGSGAALGNIGPGGAIAIRRMKLPDLPQIDAFGIDGPPGLSVLAARLGGFGEPPDLVVSGINPGHNTGRAVLHSGTVGAALTGANFGVSGLAVSTAGFGPEGSEPDWETAAAFAAACLPWLGDAPAGTVLNLNVPSRPVAEVRGVRWAELAPFGTVRTTMVGRSDEHLEMELRGGPLDEELPADSDTVLVDAGFVAVTALVGVRAAEWVPVAEHIERQALRPTP